MISECAVREIYLMRTTLPGILKSFIHVTSHVPCMSGKAERSFTRNANRQFSCIFKETAHPYLGQEIIMDCTHRLDSIAFSKYTRIANF